MARLLPNQPLMPSVLDRLVDPDPDGTTLRHGYSHRQMLESVRRDLEDLFNTHQSVLDLPDAYVEVEKSIVTYGLPDLPSLYAVSKNRGQDVRELIVAVINRYEPRLRDVRVHLSGDHESVDRRLRFHIEAGLNVDPSPEVEFETILELGSGKASIKTTGA